MISSLEIVKRVFYTVEKFITWRFFIKIFWKMDSSNNRIKMLMMFNLEGNFEFIMKQGKNFVE